MGTISIALGNLAGTVAVRTGLADVVNAYRATTTPKPASLFDRIDSAALAVAGPALVAWGLKMLGRGPADGDPGAQQPGAGAGAPNGKVSAGVDLQLAVSRDADGRRWITVGFGGETRSGSIDSDVEFGAALEAVGSVLRTKGQAAALAVFDLIMSQAELERSKSAFAKTCDASATAAAAPPPPADAPPATAAAT